VTDADEHIRASKGTSVTYETKERLIPEIQNEQIPMPSYLLGNVIALGHLDAWESMMR
jgi:hypothetical protein